MRAYRHPRYWIYWLAVACARLVACLPHSLLMLAGQLTGKLAYHMARKRRAIAQKNLELCFPEHKTDWHRHCVEQHFISLGQAVFELPLAWWGTPQRIGRLCQITGLEHLKHALAQQRGALLLCGHFSALELATRAWQRYFKGQVAVMYRRLDNPFLEALVANVRKQLNVEIIEKNNVKALLRALKRNKLVIYLPDQNVHEHHVFAPFFDISTATTTATTRILQISKTILIGYHYQRLAHHQGYHIQFTNDLSLPTGDPLQDATQINLWIEKNARQTPPQYYWVHRRFKTRPPESPATLY